MRTLGVILIAAAGLFVLPAGALAQDGASANGVSTTDALPDAATTIYANPSGDVDPTTAEKLEEASERAPATPDVSSQALRGDNGRVSGPPRRAEGVPQ